MLESGWSDNLFDNFLIGCSCIIGTCSWFTRFLSLPVSHSIALSLVTLFSSVFMRWWWFFKIIRTLNLLHLHWGSVPSIPPIFSGVITFHPPHLLPFPFYHSNQILLFFCPAIKEEQELATFKHIWMNLALQILGCLPKRIGCQSEGMIEEKDERSIDERDVL